MRRATAPDVVVFPECMKGTNAGESRRSDVSSEEEAKMPVLERGAVDSVGSNDTTQGNGWRNVEWKPESVELVARSSRDSGRA